MRQRVIGELQNPNGAEAKGARYRETLQTTGCYVDRIVIVPRESAPILQTPPDRRQQRHSEGHQNAFSEASRNLSLRWRVGFPTKPGQEHRLPPMAPGPGSRTRQEERALLIVPMSSDRLFLDRVARQHCPSPLHRHCQNNMHPLPAPAEQDISTLQRIGHFYFALTVERNSGANRFLI